MLQEMTVPTKKKEIKICQYKTRIHSSQAGCPIEIQQDFLLVQVENCTWVVVGEGGSRKYPKSSLCGAQTWHWPLAQDMGIHRKDGIW